VLVKHSRDMDQFLKVAIKRMTETQILVNELKEVGKLNSVLLKEKQEFEAKLAEESQAKDGKHFPDAFSFIIESCPSEL
jgi:ABC-type Zn2+ transport system substrate-binding protein/surface adhesin